MDHKFEDGDKIEIVKTYNGWRWEVKIAAGGTMHPGDHHKRYATAAEAATAVAAALG